MNLQEKKKVIKNEVETHMETITDQELKEYIENTIKSAIKEWIKNNDNL